MQYTVRAFVGGRDYRLDEMCRTFCSMERTAYSLLREGAGTGSIKATLRSRYGVWNARWCQSAINQARAIMSSQEEGIRYRIEQSSAKARNMKEKIGRLSNPLKVEGCRRKMESYESKAEELSEQLRTKSYPNAVFGSSKLFHQLSIAEGTSREDLRREWREKRANRFFSVGQANQRGNGNTRLSCEGDSFLLGVRNWPGGDFTLPLLAPEHWSSLLGSVIEKANAVKTGGLPYSVRMVRFSKGYQVLVSFELDEPEVEWTGRLAGIDMNPEGIACTIMSGDGNLLATRFFRDSRLITASKNKRKWVLEDTINRMLRWCRDTHGCNAVAVEDLRFKGAYDRSPRTNFKLSNFMKRKMLQTLRLHALKIGMISVEVDPAYTSKAGLAKYGRFGGFNRHQLAAFVIGRRALGDGEAPVTDCLPKTGKDRRMWNHCVRSYGYQPRIQTLPSREPVDRKSGWDVNRGGAITELLTAPPADSSERGLSHAPPVTVKSSRRAGWVHPNGHASRGDGARGHRASPPPSNDGVASLLSHDTEDTEIW